MSCELLVLKHKPRLNIAFRIANANLRNAIQDIGQHVLKVCLRASVAKRRSGFLTFYSKNPGVAQAIGSYLYGGVSQAGDFVYEKRY